MVCTIDDNGYFTIESNSYIGLKYDNGYVTVHDGYNDFKIRFNSIYSDDIISLLDGLGDYTEYDEETDEEYTPEEINLDRYSAGDYTSRDISNILKDNYYGNYVVVDRIPYIIDIIEAFKPLNKLPSGKTYTKAELNEMSLPMLNIIINNIKSNNSEDNDDGKGE